MIASTKKLEKYCTDYQNIENYTEAVKSTLRYDLHHRLEIDEMQSVSDLIFLHLYYHRPPEELIFLEHGEHVRLHNAGKQLSTETRQKMSNAKKNMSEETRQKLSEAGKGKHPSAETRQKISDANKGKPGAWLGKHHSEETRKKLSESHSGKHWHLENGYRIYTD